MMKYLVVGLGNIGSEYAETRHNIGFKVADAFTEASAASFSPGRYGDIATTKLRGRPVVVLKPSTYMNLSGKAVDYWLRKEKISLDGLLVITDDLALPFGKQRLRLKGSDGGHNGLKSINAVLGRNDYARLRIGVGNEFERGRQVDYVLGEWNEEERNILPQRIEVAVETVRSFISVGGSRTMTAFNNR